MQVTTLKLVRWARGPWRQEGIFLVSSVRRGTMGYYATLCRYYEKSPGRFVPDGVVSENVPTDQLDYVG